MKDERGRKRREKGAAEGGSDEVGHGKTGRNGADRSLVVGETGILPERAAHPGCPPGRSDGGVGRYGRSRIVRLVRRER